MAYSLLQTLCYFAINRLYKWMHTLRRNRCGRSHNNVKISPIHVLSYSIFWKHLFNIILFEATPEEPYPFINECTENGKNCTVSAQDPLNITCTASRYFPNIDLLFLNGGHKVSTIETVEWENDDGTKSKLIFTRVPPSKIPYVCMAFNIPGSQDERTSTISVFDHHANTTFGEPTETDLARFFKIGMNFQTFTFVTNSFSIYLTHYFFSTVPPLKTMSEV